MAAPNRARSVKGPESRRVAKGTGKGTGRKRLTKSDGPIAKLAEIKSSANLVIPEVKKVLLAKHELNKQRTALRHNNIFPSEMARSEWCPRATYYRMSGLPEPSDSSVSFSLENVFAEGNRIHEKWQSWLAETGDLWGDWYCHECDTRINNSLKPDSYLEVGESTHAPHDWKYKEVTLGSTTHRISGHADGAMYSKNCLIEIKSMGIGTFRFEAPKLMKDHTYTIDGKNITDIEGMWKSLNRPLLSHVKQGNIYLFMAEEMGMPFSEIVFIYEFKANQQIKEFRISRSDDILRPMLDTATQIEYALKLGYPPLCRNGTEGCATCRAYEK